MGEIAENSAAAVAPAVRPALPVIAASLGLVVAVMALLEFSRRAGISLPVPFLLLYASVVLTAGLTGIRGGLIAAMLVSGFVIYCSAIGYGPENLTGGTLSVAAGVGLAFFAGGVLGLYRDTRQRLITTLKERETTLRKTQEQLARELARQSDELAGLTTEFSRLRNQVSSATRNSPAGVVVVDRKRTVQYLNDAAARMFGLASRYDARINIDEFLAERNVYIDGGKAGGDRPGPLKDAVDRGIVTDAAELRVLLPDDSIRWIRGSFAPIQNDSGGIDGATIILIDVTDKVKARLKLEELSRRLLHVQEEERSYIARELHDEIGQHLTGIKLFLHSAARDTGNTGVLDTSIERIDQLMNTVRNLALEFRPSVLDDLGLVAALRWYIGRQPVPDGCDIRFDATATGESLSAGAVTAAFRIVQEGVTNALRYSGASTISVHLYNDGEQFCIVIKDEGCGFDPDLAGAEHDAGFGLVFMRERVRELDGTLTIDAAPGKGTRIAACFPVQVNA